MQSEFQALTGITCYPEQYRKIEEAYYACGGMNKTEFCLWYKSLHENTVFQMVLSRMIEFEARYKRASEQITFNNPFLLLNPMEKILKVEKVFETTEREFTNRQGKQDLFVSRGIILSDGIDRLYVQQTGNDARKKAPTEGEFYTVQLRSDCRSWQDANGATHYSNEIYVVTLNVAP